MTIIQQALFFAATSFSAYKGFHEDQIFFGVAFAIMATVHLVLLTLTVVVEL